MCSICKVSPCEPGCPNERESLPACAECGSTVYPWQEHYNLKGHRLHSSCIELLDCAEVLSLLNIKPHTIGSI